MRIRVDSSKWTATIGEPSLPPDLARLRTRPLYSDDQNRAFGAAALLIFSPVLLGIAVLVVDMSSDGLVIAAPPILESWPIPAVFGALLCFLVRENRAPRLIGAASLFAIGLVAAAALTYAVAGIAARASAPAGPVLRAQVHSVSPGPGHSRRTRFVLADGSTALTWSTVTRTRACYAVRRIEGSFGFAWLEIVDSSPRLGPGQLEWPIAQADCFSGAPLGSLGG